MPPNTRGSTRPSQSQNVAKAPVQQSHRAGAVTAHDNDHDNVSGAQAAADEEPMELFLDLMLGTPILFYVEKDVTNREQIVKLIRVHGGALSSSYTTVNYILVDPTSEAGHNLFLQFQNKKGKVILDARWITACVRAKDLITYKGDWAGFRVKGHERSVYLQNPVAHDDADADPPPVAEAHVANNVAPQLPKTVPEPLQRQRTPPNPPPNRSQVDTVSTVQATPQSHQQGSVTDSTQSTPLVDPSRPSPGSIYYAAPHAGMIYHYPPQFNANAHHFRPHVVAHPGPAPAPWGPIAMPFPAAPMFAPVPPQAVQPAQHQQTTNVNPTPAHPQPIPTAIPYAAFDYSQHAGYPPATAPPSASSWYEYYAHMPPDLYQRSAADLATYGVGIAIHPQPTAALNGSPRSNAVAGPSGSSQPDPDAAAGEDEGGESSPPRRTRGRTKVRNINQSGARINVKATAPFTRSPTPPTRIVKSTYGGNLFTEEDVEYLRKYMAYCQEQGVLLSLREICERLAVRAPHHTFFSWRRYCNKHQIRLGGYNLETQDDEDGDGGDDQEALEEENVAGPSGTSAELGKRKRTGSPVPPKILYKSTTGKGVAFTTADVQYLLDYLKYRREQNPALDMVEFWNDIAVRAPHHSRASWMKYWRRHKHELEPQTDGSVQAPYTPIGKKSRYTKEDDILLAKYFFVNQRPPSNAPGATGLANPIPGKTSDAIFQEFAKLHPQHPWKGWQEHHRLHKREIDLMIKKLDDGEEI